MRASVFKFGVILLGTSLLGWLLDFLIVRDQSMMSHVLVWYLWLGGAGLVLILAGSRA